MGKLPEYPSTFEEALDDVAFRYHLKVLRYEYWGVPIRTLRWVDGTILRSVQFDYRENNIGVTLQAERTGGIFSFYRWCYNVIPMFPYLLQNTCAVMPDLGKSLSIAEYVRQLEALVEKNM
ncbi:MAG: hypothetical protein IPI97_10510 [Nitrosomonas sp.]|nr:hypothetical protein [Nitrosomonas sp.]